MTLMYRAPSAAAASMTGSAVAMSRPAPTAIASAHSTRTPVSVSRRRVSASMGEPGSTGHASSPGVTGAMRRPTVLNPAAAARPTNSGGATSSIVRCSRPIARFIPHSALL